MKNKRILVIASAGGHLIQLHRLKPAYAKFDYVVVTNRSLKGSQMFADASDSFVVTDCNLNTKLKLLKVFFELFAIVLKSKPDAIITTGAAPGLVAILVGKILIKKIIWIDSIANAEKLSSAGTVAKRLTKFCYSQWPDVAKENKIGYIGKVI